LIGGRKRRRRDKGDERRTTQKKSGSGRSRNQRRRNRGSREKTPWKGDARFKMSGVTSSVQKRAGDAVRKGGGRTKKRGKTEDGPGRIDLVIRKTKNSNKKKKKPKEKRRERRGDERINV